MRAAKQEGRWSDINLSASSKVIEKDVFSFWFEHGVSPKDASYAYIIVPNIAKAAQMNEYLAKQHIEILRNDIKQQVVKSNQDGVYGFVFHNPNSSFKAESFELQVSEPCVMLLKKEDRGEFRLHVADPTKKLSQIKIKFKRVGDKHFREHTLVLPAEEKLAGKSVFLAI